MKFCTDCKHMRPAPDGNPYRVTCASPLNSVPTIAEEKYLVSGIEQPMILAMRGASCTALRMRRDAETQKLTCGPDGNWFEEKEEAL